jgi:hypothetical protein
MQMECKVVVCQLAWLCEAQSSPGWPEPRRSLKKILAEHTSSSDIGTILPSALLLGEQLDQDVQSWVQRSVNRQITRSNVEIHKLQCFGENSEGSERGHDGGGGAAVAAARVLCQDLLQ